MFEMEHIRMHARTLTHNWLTPYEAYMTNNDTFLKSTCLQVVCWLSYRGTTWRRLLSAWCMLQV